MQVPELVAFAVDFDINMSKSKCEGRSGRVGQTGREQEGRYLSGVRRDQSMIGGGYVAQVEKSESRACYGCGETEHINAKFPKRKSDENATLSRVA